MNSERLKKWYLSKVLLDLRNVSKMRLVVRAVISGIFQGLAFATLMMIFNNGPRIDDLKEFMFLAILFGLHMGWMIYFISRQTQKGQIKEGLKYRYTFKETDRSDLLQLVLVSVIILIVIPFVVIRLGL